MSRAIVLDQTRSAGVLSRADLAARTEESAREIIARYRRQRVERTAAFAVAWPSSEDDTGGFGVLLIAAQSHVAAELPVRRVALRTQDGGEVELPRVAGKRSAIAAKSVAASVFGRFQDDSFYWAPLARLVTPGVIVLDFAAARSDFTVGSLPIVAPEWYVEKKRRESHPNAPVLRALSDRQFPGFLRRSCDG